MTACQYAQGGNNSFSFFPQSAGVSDAFQQVMEYKSDWEKHSSVPNSTQSHKKDVLELFTDIAADAFGKKDWDGEGAEAIVLETIFIAYKVIELFDEGIPLPEIVPEPNGDIGMEWVTSSEHLVISVSKDKGYTYAYISEEGDRFYGSGKIKSTGLPQKVINLLPK